MKAEKVPEIIKKVSEFADRLDKNLNQKLNIRVGNHELKVKHVVALLSGYAALHGVGITENANCNSEIFLGTAIAALCGAATVCMGSVKYIGKDENSEQTIGNHDLKKVTKFLCEQFQDGKKEYKNGEYDGTIIINTYDGTPREKTVYQYREYLKSRVHEATKTGKALQQYLKSIWTQRRK